MKKVVSAGGIIVRKNTTNEILLVIHTYSEGLGFPKGHVEDNETLEQTALREVKEETGLTNLTIIRKLGVYSKLGIERDGKRVDKDVHMYLMTTPLLDFHLPAEEKYGWFNLDYAISHMSSIEDRKFLESIISELI